MSERLVSVTTPCYNGEKYIHKLLDSVLDQTYPAIEMTVVDDGSTDGSADIIKSYIQKFEDKGYRLRYVYQRNQGQSVAINNALKMVEGDYLVWPDADDYYASPRSIAEMVRRLEESDDNVSMVRTQYNILNEQGDIVDRLGVTDESRYKTDLFEDAVLGANGFWYPPGGYMAKVAKIDELIPGRDIYTEKNAGQNFQLYLPLLYDHTCITIEEYLYSIVAHDDSHSRNMETNNSRQQMYYRTIKNTLKRMDIDSGYMKYLLEGVRLTVRRNSQSLKKGRPYRKYVKMAIKGMLPHGLIVLYRRRFQ